MENLAMEELRANAARLGAELARLGWTLSTAESCTAGLLAWAITETAGSSQWFGQGIVSYSNQAKQSLLGVSAQTLLDHGAVSTECALEMAEGALRSSSAQLALSVTGIAGPGGGSPEKPVGLVCFAAAHINGQRWQEKCHFLGNRSAVRQQAAEHAIVLGMRCIQQLA